MAWGDRKAYERIRDEEKGRSESWSERPAPALHQPKLTIQTSGRGRHDENDLKIAQRVVDLEATLEQVQSLANGRHDVTDRRLNSLDATLEAVNQRCDQLREDLDTLEDRVRRIDAAGPLGPAAYKCPCNVPNGCDNPGCDKPLYGTRATDDDASEWEDDENPTFIAAALFPKSLPSTRIRIHLMKFNRPANEAEALSRAQSWADSEDGTMVTVQRLR